MEGKEPKLNLGLMVKEVKKQLLKMRKLNSELEKVADTANKRYHLCIVEETFDSENGCTLTVVERIA